MIADFFSKGIAKTLYAAASFRKRRIKKQASKKYKFAVLAIMKNEAMNIDEWLSHYISQGADQIYLIDNGSTDETLEKVKKWTAKGKVDIIVLNERGKQKKHYWTAFNRFKIRQNCEWLLIADLDEFLFSKDGVILSDALGDYRDYDVIYVNWSIFGSSGFKQHPDSLRLNLCLRQPELGPHSCRKWIARTSALEIKEQLKIHHISGVCSSRTISENARFQMNHYVTQSMEFFAKVKMARGDVFSPQNDAVRDMAYFHRYDDPCTVEDRQLADMLLRKQKSPTLAQKEHVQKEPALA